MPAIDTLVADLNAGTITRIGAKPDSLDTNIEKTISGTCRVKHYFVHMNATITGTSLSFRSAKTSPTFNGSYIHFEDDWSTVGNMDINRKLLASGNFSGCTYKIYRSGPGQYRGVHIARPAGAGANALVALAGAYSGQQNWVELQSVPTTGCIGVNGCTEVIVVSQLFLGVRIDTVRLEVDNTGTIVGRTFYTSNA